MVALLILWRYLSRAKWLLLICRIVLACFLVSLDNVLMNFLKGNSSPVKAITTSLHSRSVLGRVIVESLTKELQLKRMFGCE